MSLRGADSGGAGFLPGRAPCARALRRRRRLGGEACRLSSCFPLRVGDLLVVVFVLVLVAIGLLWVRRDRTGLALDAVLDRLRTVLRA